LVIVPLSDGPPETVIENVSEFAPGSPLSVTVTVKLNDPEPFFVHVPENVAVLPETLTLVIVILWTFTF
jgi:hypothetical protein